MNLLLYADANPVRYIDPLGLASICGHGEGPLYWYRTWLVTNSIVVPETGKVVRAFYYTHKMFRCGI